MAAANRVVVEADGGSRGNPGPAAFGAVLKDAADGRVLAEAAEPIGVATNNVAEYRGLIAGLELAREHAPGASVEVRMDSKLVIEQMAGRWRVKHADMRPLALQARRLAPAEVTWTWVPREQNAHADRLLNAALDATAGRTVTDQVTSPAATGRLRVAVPDPTAGVTTRLILLRHGETEQTVARRFSGRNGSDPGLTDEGRDQAVRAAAWLARHGGVDAVVTSPLRRARETAQVVAERLGLGVDVDDGLAEANFGAWDGYTYAEVRDRWPAELDEWLGAPGVAPPGGESLDDLDRRVRQAGERLVGGHAGQAVVAVTHLTPIKSLVRMALDAPVQSLYRMELTPASITVTSWYDDGLGSLQQFAVVP